MPILDNACLRIFSPDRGPETDMDLSEPKIQEPKFMPKPQSGASDLDKAADGDEEEYFTGKNFHQQLVYIDKNYQGSLLSRLNTLRRNRELCDVVVYVDQREIYAHRAVLASLSPLLYELVTAGNNNTTSYVSNGSSTSNGTTHPAMVQNGSDHSATSKDGWTNGKEGEEPREKTANGGGAQMEETRVLYLEFNGVSYDCFQAILDYAYTAKLEISCGMVADLYKTACMLRVGECAKVCANYLADNLNPENCIGVRRCANKTNDSLLATSVDKYIQEHFGKIVHGSKEFTSLPLVQVEVIWAGVTALRDETDCRRLGEKVLEWFQAQELPDHMEFRMEQLTEKVHLLHAGVDLVLQDCVDMDDASSVGSCDLVQDYKRSFAKDKQRKKSGSPNHQVPPAQIPLTGPPVTNGVSGGGRQQPYATGVAGGGSRLSRFSSTDSLNSTNSVAEADEIEWKLIALTKPSSCYSIALAVLHRQLVAVSIQLIQDTELGGPINEEGEEPEEDMADRGLLHPFGRVQIPLMASPRCSVGAVNLNGKLFVCGGYDRGECMKTVEVYDPGSNRWELMPPMLKERGRFDATLCRGRVYAIGGSDSKRDLDSAEVFDPQTGHWSLLPKMNIAKSNNGCASVGGKVYCIGGWNGQTGIKLCERFSPELNRWELIASLAVGRSQASCCSWNGGILAVGGCDGWTCTNSVEFYDAKTNNWKLLSPMTTCRRGCGIAVLKDKLYVAGGSDGINSQSSVEVLDLKSGLWSQGPPLTTPRANVRLVAVGELIFAVGGFNGKTFLNSVECFEPSSGHGWRTWMLMSSRSRQNSRTFQTLKDSLEVLTTTDPESGVEVDASSLSSPGSNLEA